MNEGTDCLWSAGERSLDGEVHVWWYHLDLDSGKEVSFEPSLSNDERGRAARFRFAEHRHRFIVGRGTLRNILAQYTGTDPRDIRFEHGAHGKPRLAGPVSARGISFNASNSHGIGAVAVARGLVLGLDLELISPARDCELIAARQFASEEVRWLNALPESERLDAFFELWTCKEAYLKGKGLGLTVPLKGFAMQLRPGAAPHLAWSTIGHSDAKRWSFHRLALAPGYAATLAIEGTGFSVRLAPWPPESPGHRPSDTTTDRAEPGILTAQDLRVDSLVAPGNDIDTVTFRD